MADAKVVIRGDSSGAVKATDDVKKGFDDIPKSSNKAGAALGRVAGALAVAAAGFAAFKKAMDLAAEFGEFERQTLRIGALLRATGAVSGQTRTELLKLASDVGRTTLLDERQVQDAIGILLTFRSVQGETFERAIRLSADLSEVMGGDVRAATLQLAKALEEPTVGLTALRRSGINFSEQQQTQIKLLVEQNRLFEAQTIILDEVATQMDEVATRAAEGYAGALDGLGQSTREVTRIFGKHIAEALEPAIRKYDIYLRMLGMFVDRSDRATEAIVAQAEAEARANRVEGLTLQEQVLQNINRQIQQQVALESRYLAIIRDVNTSDFQRRTYNELISDAQERRKVLTDALRDAVQDQTRFLERNTRAVVQNTRANEEAARQAEEAARRRRIQAAIEQGRTAAQVSARDRTDTIFGLALPTIQETATETQNLADTMTDAEARAIQMGIAMQGIHSVGVLLANDFPTIGAGLETVFGRGSKAAKAFFGVYKAAAIATTTIATYEAAQAANANAQKLFGPAGLIIGPIAAAAEVVSGLAKVAKIKQTKIGGGTPAGGALSTPSLNSSTVSPPRPSDTFVGPDGALFTAPPSDTPELVAQIDGRDLVFFLTRTQTDLEKVAIG